MILGIWHPLRKDCRGLQNSDWSVELISARFGRFSPFSSGRGGNKRIVAKACYSAVLRHVFFSIPADSCHRCGFGMMTRRAASNSSISSLSATSTFFTGFFPARSRNMRSMGVSHSMARSFRDEDRRFRYMLADAWRTDKKQVVANT